MEPITKAGQKFFNGVVNDSKKPYIKNKHAVAMGKIGGANRAKNLSKQERIRIAKMGADKRWEHLKSLTKID